MTRHRPPNRLEDAMLAIAMVAFTAFCLACLGAMLAR